jgi:hypothetical protein
VKSFATPPGVDSLQGFFILTQITGFQYMQIQETIIYIYISISNMYIYISISIYKDISIYHISYYFPQYDFPQFFCELPPSSHWHQSVETHWLQSIELVIELPAAHD